MGAFALSVGGAMIAFGGAVLVGLGALDMQRRLNPGADESRVIAYGLATMAALAIIVLTAFLVGAA